MHANHVIPLHEVGRLISVRETCQILGVSVATIDRMVKAGTLHAVRPTGPRGDRRFRIEDVIAIRSRCSDRAAGDGAAA